MLSKTPEYTQGEIVWADYPLSDKPAKSKIRPVIIVSNANSNALDNDLLILPITSRIRSELFEIVLTDEMTTVSLPARSAVRCNKLHTIRNTRIIGKIAAVTPTALKEIIKTVCLALSLLDETSG
ncbi:type II toxin-antitoxin system PemK/MazF family toxin [Spirosoma utsteinense]|uniref:mRNA-degrading endonuclease toxin of MazEF toxin-antitoxin module n=1 Tax=Spirosoma utsteinense TaxID=2585773 RepID=A0ABR6WAN9_9BACT|nr:type II toxin-antitoxin system PemK/MazF family toxin [Spirosoma utsteinense]MBC3787848.1 mRNA-degrading endonuclease toxin of MazEF toxin-antitoxin module [Spirosoma utsteinense]MBC3793636.1 mRNA-degrading endonuclease toxin of MazEF toxin-antitoxin module [Spirosoma utsteinense]